MAEIDGHLGEKTYAAVKQGLGRLGQPAPADAASWSDRRRTVAFLQMYAEAEGIDPGPIDGLWGPQTDYAVSALAEKLEDGAVREFVDEAPTSRPAGGFPDETRSQAELRTFYGPPGRKDGSVRPPLVKVPLPWKMKLGWNRRQHRSYLWAHEKVADSLARVLARVDAQFDAAQKADLGIDIFSGDYAPRQMRGANRASLHSWGIAFDFDAERNQLRWNRHRARLGQPDAIPFWEAWEAEGWCALGRVRNYDFMHVQAARRAY
ncbi:MAG: M15 family metallopeptidase [Acuticoccus sp.]